MPPFSFTLAHTLGDREEPPALVVLGMTGPVEYRIEQIRYQNTRPLPTDVKGFGYCVLASLVTAVAFLLLNKEKLHILVFGTSYFWDR